MSQAEDAIDRAKNRLDAIDKAEGDCQTAIEELLGKLQSVVGCTDKDRLRAIECMWETLSDMTFDVRSDLRRDIGQHEDDINAADFADLNRSAPVTL